jgi:hypothetical protein
MLQFAMVNLLEVSPDLSGFETLRLPPELLKGENTMAKRGGKSRDFEPDFEGVAVLDALLELCGGVVDTPGAIEAMRQAHQAGQDRSEVIPTLFEGEPRPPSPEVAQKLFENLLGLWQLIEQNRKIPLGPSDGPPRVKVKKESLPPPPPFAAELPTTEEIEVAWRYLEGVNDREKGRLLDAFENRHDAVLSHLDEPGLSDEGYATARQLCFEVFALLELGVPRGTRGVHPEELSGGKAVRGDAPPSLVAFVDEALFEAQQDEEQPLSHDESARVRERVLQVLRAFWNARKA